MINFTPSQLEIIKILKSKGGVWIVGGCVRDMMLGLEPKDLDLTTNILPDECRSLLSDKGYTIIPDATAYHHGITRIVDKDSGEIIDIATLRKDITCDGRHAAIEFTNRIDEDLQRRDFTINAMAYDLHVYSENCPLDLFGGKQHLEEKLVSFVGYAQDRIEEDALRMLRACRFTALDPDWTLAPTAESAIRTFKGNLTSISKERIQSEIMKAMAYPCPVNFWRALESTGLLEFVMPALMETVSCEQNHWHLFETVWAHITRALEVGTILTDNPLLRLAIIMHDVGKPNTLSIDSDGGRHFYRHEVVGANIIKEWMKEFKFSNDEIKYVTTMVRHHQFWFTEETSKKTIRKWLQKVGKDNWVDLLILRAADRGGNAGNIKDGKGIVTARMQELYNTIKEMIDNGEPIFIEDLLVNGDDLKTIIKPGPIYKEIFSQMLGIVHANPKLNTKEWLLNFVRKRYGHH